MPGSFSNFEFDPFRATSVWSEDADGRRCQRVILTEPISGSSPGAIAQAYDEGGVVRRILATEIPGNTGFYRLSVDSELTVDLSGSSFQISNIRVGSLDNTSGSTQRYLLVDDAGTSQVYDRFLESSSAYQGKESSDTGSLIFGYYTVSLPEQAIEGQVIRLRATNIGELYGYDTYVSSSVVDLQVIVSAFSASNKYELQAFSSSNKFELEEFSSSLKFEVQAFSSSNKYELQAVSGAIETLSGAIHYDMLAFSASNKYELQAVSGAIRAFSGAVVDELQQLSSSIGEVSATVSASVSEKVVQIGGDDGAGAVSRIQTDTLGRLQVCIVAGSTPLLQDWTCTAAESVGDTVYNLAGVARQANADATATMPVIGIIFSKSDATNCVVVSGGALDGILAGMTPGAWYYADIANGGITTTVPSLGGGFASLQALGYAKSATDFVIDRQPAITL